MKEDETGEGAAILPAEALSFHLSLSGVTSPGGHLCPKCPSLIPGWLGSPSRKAQSLQGPKEE